MRSTQFGIGFHGLDDCLTIAGIHFAVNERAQDLIVKIVCVFHNLYFTR